jgi:hypothetical protein
MMMMIINLFGQLGLWAPSLFRGARRTHIKHICFRITPPSLRSRDILVMGRKHP